MGKSAPFGGWSNWRSVRMWESHVARDLRSRHWLWLHGLCIGAVTLLVTWGTSTLLMHWGVQSMAVRYLVALGVGYGVYLVVLRLWAAALLRPDSTGHDGSGLDVLDVLDVSNVGGCSPHADHAPTGINSGGGGDFGGGGATGDFGELAGGAFEVAAGSDEAAIVVVPVVAVFLVGCAVLFGAGALALLYMGWEVLLAVAVELAFSYATARTAVRVSREGWASAAVRLTWKPLAGAIVCAVALGASIDYFFPTAQSLPQVFAMLK